MLLSENIFLRIFLQNIPYLLALIIAVQYEIKSMSLDLIFHIVSDLIFVLDVKSLPFSL